MDLAHMALDLRDYILSWRRRLHRYPELSLQEVQTTQALADEGTDFRLLILSDHKTLTATRGHDADPVPYLLYDSRKDTGLNLPYCEESGLKGTAYAAGAPVLMRKLFEQL